MTFTDDPARDYERFCDAQDHGAGDEYEPPEGGEGALEQVEDEALCELESAVAHASLRLDAKASAALAVAGDEEGWGSKRDNANPRGKFWDSEEPVRHEELYREDLEEPQDVL